MVFALMQRCVLVSLLLPFPTNMFRAQALAHIDKSAPMDQFITEGGRVAGPVETPIIEARVPGADHFV